MSLVSHSRPIGLRLLECLRQQGGIERARQAGPHLTYREVAQIVLRECAVPTVGRGSAAAGWLSGSYHDLAEVGGVRYLDLMVWDFPSCQSAKTRNSQRLTASMRCWYWGCGHCRYCSVRWATSQRWVYRGQDYLVAGGCHRPVAGRPGDMYYASVTRSLQGLLEQLHAVL